MRNGYRIRDNLMDDGDSSSSSNKKVFICKNHTEAIFKIRHEFGDNCKVDIQSIKKRGKGFFGFLPWNWIKCVKATAWKVSNERSIKPQKKSLKDLKLNISRNSDNSKADSILEAIYNISPSLSKKNISLQPNMSNTCEQTSVTGSEERFFSEIENKKSGNEINKGKNLDIFLGKLKEDQGEHKKDYTYGNGLGNRNGSNDSDKIINQTEKTKKIDKSAGMKSDMTVQNDVIKELKELNEMKAILKSLINENTSALEKNNPVIENMLEHLHKNGMEKTHVQVMKDVMEKNLHRYQRSDKDFIKEYVFNGLLKLVKVSDPLLPDNENMKCVALIGPTGVGKTTTLAKLATIFWHTYQCKVAFLTIDTFRIGASDQLSKFGSIIGIPTKVAFDPDEAEKGISEYRAKGYDLVLIDCFGFAPCNNNKMTDLCEFFNRIPETQKILTLSANMKYEDLIEAVNRFKFAGCSDLIITHMDSTKTYGPLISLLGETRYPLMYTTHGQNVPGDIQEANLRHIVGKVIYNETFQFTGGPDRPGYPGGENVEILKQTSAMKFAGYNSLRVSPDKQVINRNNQGIRDNNQGIRDNNQGIRDNNQEIKDNNQDIKDFLVPDISETGIEEQKKVVTPVVFTDFLEKVGSSLDSSEELSRLSMDLDLELD